MTELLATDLAAVTFIVKVKSTLNLCSIVATTIGLADRNF
jgi:hypothetical protein